MFNEIGLKLGDHEYINIAEVKFGQSYSGAVSEANQFFCTPKMLIYTNYLKNHEAALIFFTKRSATTIYAITKIINQKYCGVQMRKPKNKCLIP